MSLLHVCNIADTPPIQAELSQCGTFMDKRINKDTVLNMFHHMQVYTLKPEFEDVYPAWCLKDALIELCKFALPTCDSSSSIYRCRPFIFGKVKLALLPRQILSEPLVRPTRVHVGQRDSVCDRALVIRLQSVYNFKVFNNSCCIEIHVLCTSYNYKVVQLTFLEIFIFQNAREYRMQIYAFSGPSFRCRCRCRLLSIVVLKDTFEKYFSLAIDRC